MHYYPPQKLLNISHIRASSKWWWWGNLRKGQFFTSESSLQWWMVSMWPFYRLCFIVYLFNPHMQHKFIFICEFTLGILLLPCGKQWERNTEQKAWSIITNQSNKQEMNRDLSIIILNAHLLFIHLLKYTVIV